MSNTITLPRGDWNLVIGALKKLMNDYNLGGGSLDLILSNIDTQLDEQEY